MDLTDKRAQLREFVTRSLGTPNLAGDDDIFEVGGATSLFSVELVIFIEDSLGVPLADDDLERDNFATINAMAAMIDRKHATP
ncbi:MAG: phosphopantetheine-binding protein [Actinomycetia bacterium]|nr:phosphopantetheine-binding protein [Actinomycetes bacterium]